MHILCGMVFEHSTDKNLAVYCGLILQLVLVHFINLTLVENSSTTIVMPRLYYAQCF